MKRSTTIRLAALGGVSLALTTCAIDRRPVRTVIQTAHYASTDACTKASVPLEVCTSAYKIAYEMHRNNAPSYDSVADCEADYAIGVCVDRSVNGRVIPAMSGFAVTTQTDERQQSSSSGGGWSGSSSSGARFWRWIGFGEDNPRYYSEPLYREQSAQGVVRNVTLNDQVNTGKPFAKARNGRYSISSPGSFSADARSASAQPVHVSRGGFGARGGFGG